MTKRLFAVGVLVFTVGGMLLVGCQPQVQPQTPAYHGPGPELMLNESNFQEALSTGKPVLVDFFATWCGPCQHMAPVIEELALEYQGKVVVGKVDVDQNQALAEKYQIASLPTFLFLKDGRVVGQLVGMQPKEKLVKRLAVLVK
jgi:thioredoxin 1